VIVVATEPGVEAEAYKSVTSALLPDALDTFRRTGEVTPLINSKVLQRNFHDSV
jgi:hypothetical protein